LKTGFSKEVYGLYYELHDLPNIIDPFYIMASQSTDLIAFCFYKDIDER